MKIKLITVVFLLILPINRVFAADLENVDYDLTRIGSTLITTIIDNQTSEFDSHVSLDIILAEIEAIRSKLLAESLNQERIRG